MHPTGIAEIYLGEITGTRIELSTDVVTRTASAKEVTAGHRLYGLVGEDLAYAYDMAAVGQGLQPHLSAQLKRASPLRAAWRPLTPGRLDSRFQIRLCGQTLQPSAGCARHRQARKDPRAPPAGWQRRMPCAGTDWTRPASPGVRCLPRIRRPPPCGSKASLQNVTKNGHRESPAGEARSCRQYPAIGGTAANGQPPHVSNIYAYFWTTSFPA